MEGFLADMSELLKEYAESKSLKKAEVRRMVAQAIDRDCDDEEFEELMNVLGLDNGAKKFKVSQIRASITEAQSREEETEDSEPNYDIGDGDEYDENGADGDDFLDHVQRQPGADEQYTILDEGDDGEYGDGEGGGFLEVVEQGGGSEETDRQRKLNELEESLEYVGNEDEAPSSMETYRSKNASDSIKTQEVTGLTNGGDEYTIDLGPLSEEDVITSPQSEVGGYADQVSVLEHSLEETSTELEQLKVAHRRLLEAYR
jgi:hypothetical protein